MKKLLLAWVFLLAPFLVLQIASASTAKEPIVVYHTSGIWNGYPKDKTVSGWNSFLLKSSDLGANTGILTFTMHWDAQNQCWGMTRDCRTPQWAASQNLQYIGPLSSANLTVEIRQ